MRCEKPLDPERYIRFVEDSQFRFICNECSDQIHRADLIQIGNWDAWKRLRNLPCPGCGKQQWNPYGYENEDQATICRNCHRIVWYSEVQVLSRWRYGVDPDRRKEKDRRKMIHPDPRF